MDTVVLHMIGNSHIDPVWYWSWEEGMQAVKATFASVLDRMNEFPEFTFSSTSASFFQWIEAIDPTMLENIKQRVAEGRWEITGGFFVEPDCIMPHGESFIRQGLYSQQYFKRTFGKFCTIGSNIDSFGHTNTLPMLLNHVGMNRYIFMRPRQETPLFTWNAPDGSSVRTLSLPGEYTTWFDEPTRANMALTLQRMKPHERMACCYGVGNHGGGPTRQNIATIMAARDEGIYGTLLFSTFERFFNDVEQWELPVVSGAFEGINTGCWTNDNPFKHTVRLAERRLIEADTLSVMAMALGGKIPSCAPDLKTLWNVLLFNQFHDVYCGTAVGSARDEALRQIGGCAAGANLIKAFAIQAIANSIDTDGEGNALLCINPLGYDFCGCIEVELEWFCKDPLTIYDPNWNEVPYQRIPTECKATHSKLGGRRRVLFKASIPAMGFALYRVVQREPKVTEAEPKVSIEVGQTAVILENAYLKALFDPNDGALCALIDKTTGYDALHGRTQWRLWQDQRDTWGHLQGLPFRDTGTCYCVQRFEVIEQGPLRCGLHIELSHESSRLEQYYFLTHDSAHLVVEHVLDWDKPWHLLQWTLPIAASLPRVRAETAYGVLDRCPTSGQEYFMQRWLDVADSLTGKGLIVAGSDTQAFTYSDNTLGLIALRSPVMAQMNSPGWNEGAQQLRFSNLGHHRFHVALHPHGSRQPNHVGYRLADEVATVCTYLHTDNHHGRSDASRWSMAFSDQANVRPVLMKKAECGNDVVVRLFETDGRACSGTLQLLGHAYYFSIQAYGLATIKIDSINQRSCMVNGLEEPVDGQENDSWQKKER